MQTVDGATIVANLFVCENRLAKTVEPLSHCFYHANTRCYKGSAFFVQAGQSWCLLSHQVDNVVTKTFQEGLVVWVSRRTPHDHYAQMDLGCSQPYKRVDAPSLYWQPRVNSIDVME